jgi:hypothetical protein
MLIADVVAFVGLFMTGHINAFLLFWLLGLPSIIVLYAISQSGQQE